ncbi:P-loop NTPase family protein [Cohnella fermenti]|nr:AAA family ATPase [Cohnella fermenti]
MRRLVVAVPEPQYAAKLVRYLGERRPHWEVKAFTQELALGRYLADGGDADAILAHETLRDAVGSAIKKIGFPGKILLLHESEGEEREENGEIAMIPMYQPLPSILAAIENELPGEPGRAIGSGGGSDGSNGRAAVWTVFSASGGAGKTTVALNLVRQLGERGCRALYLNLEPLNATDLLLGSGHPDSLSALLYGMQANPERAGEEWKLRRKQHSVLLGDYLDAPDHPAERLAMSPARMKELLQLAAGCGRYDVVVLDPDSGSGEWHREALAMSDRVAWLVTPEAMGVRKAEKLLRHWQGQSDGKAEGSASLGLADKIAWVINQSSGHEELGDRLPHGERAVRLPYMPQWRALGKGPEELGKLLKTPAFCGAIERIVEAWGFPAKDIRPARAGRRREEARNEGGAVRSRIG